MSRNEDRELQIKLAQLQTDIQIHLSACFGLAAGFLALIIFYMQIFFNLSAEQILLKNLFGAVVLIASGFLLFLLLYSFQQIKATKKRMEELKKQYIW